MLNDILTALLKFFPRTKAIYYIYLFHSCSKQLSCAYRGKWTGLGAQVPELNGHSPCLQHLIALPTRQTYTCS